MQPTKLLHESSAAFDFAITDVDAKKLRTAFAELVDQSLSPLNTARLDLDDVLLEHHAKLHDTRDQPQSALSVELITLSDRDVWIKSYDRAREAAGMSPCDPESTRFQSIQLKILREIDNPVPDFSVQPDL